MIMTRSRWFPDHVSQICCKIDAVRGTWRVGQQAFHMPKCAMPLHVIVKMPDHGDMMTPLNRQPKTCQCTEYTRP